MGNTVKLVEHVEDLKTGDNMIHSKEGIEETTNGNSERDLVENNHVNEPSEQITTVNPEKMVNKTNTKEKTKRDTTRREKVKRMF